MSLPSYPEAWQIDLPTYAEVKHDFPDFGFDKLTVDAVMFPIISSRMASLDTRFYARYCQRQIGFETLQLWQMKLQNRFDDIAEKYERGFKLYTDNRTAMDRAVEGLHVTTETKNRFIDTPDSAVNDDDDYADSQSRNRTEGTNELTGGRAVKSVNENIDSFGNIDQRFLAEFEDLFINILSD